MDGFPRIYRPDREPPAPPRAVVPPVAPPGWIERALRACSRFFANRRRYGR